MWRAEEKTVMRGEKFFAVGHESDCSEEIYRKGRKEAQRGAKGMRLEPSIVIEGRSLKQQ
jgi:hypothetical protein